MCASQGRCGQATPDAGMPRPTSADRCVQAKGNAGRPRPSSAERCAQATSDASNPWLMPPDVGKRRLPDAPKCHVRCAQALANAAWPQTWNAPAAYIDPHAPSHLTWL
ncbi:hypothetical protein KY290_012796 [Solanum tuberosum]|uniref:Uncharacterized protein n=1 Tax=Solanum tuberosum TaxID=4113 RepID=A0ABQ7VKL7_SOLTU|nr:hypothetical protein KY289_013174 [Solanum tuberosum]KAH0768815.1 hypothetical protein KY290_012796 [Solanum tuberosum]